MSLSFHSAETPDGDPDLSSTTSRETTAESECDPGSTPSNGHPIVGREEADRDQEIEGEDQRDRPVVLVVDDEEALVEVYSRWLSETCSVRTATSGRAALEQVDGVDLVFVDRKMPGLSGEELLQRLAALEDPPRSVIISALHPDAAVADIPHEEYLKKPVDAADLQRAVADVLDRESSE